MPQVTQISRHARQRPASGCLATIGARVCGALPPRSRGFRVRRRGVREGRRRQPGTGREGGFQQRGRGILKCVFWRASLTPSSRSWRPWASRVQASFFASQDMRLGQTTARLGHEVRGAGVDTGSAPRPWRSASAGTTTGGSSPPRDSAHVLDCNNKFRALITCSTNSTTVLRPQGR